LWLFALLECGDSFAAFAFWLFWSAAILSPLWLSALPRLYLWRGRAMTADAARVRLIEQILRLPEEALAEAAALLSRWRPVEQRPARSEGIDDPITVTAPVALRPVQPRPTSTEIDWPHAPPHRLSQHGTYFVTTGTLHKAHYFRGADRLDHLHAELLRHAAEAGWQLEAWAVFSNHYHFVAHARPEVVPMGAMLKELHRTTSIFVNQLDGEPGRQVWFNFRDKELTYESSYYARLAYVHNNPVKHGLVAAARRYRWCSAAWFERTASPAQVATLTKIKTDSVNVFDDYQPV
jgi:putative transposase